jgi:hypothetical protein
LSDNTDAPDENHEKQAAQKGVARGRRTYASGVIGGSISLSLLKARRGSGTGKDDPYGQRKKTRKAKAAQPTGEFADLIASLTTEPDLFVSTKVPLHPRFKELLDLDAKENNRSRGVQLMVGYLTYRSLSPATLRKRARLLGRLGAWINDHDVPQEDKEAFDEILRETQSAFRGE